MGEFLAVLIVIGSVVFVIWLFSLFATKERIEEVEEIEEIEVPDINPLTARLTESYLTLENYVGQDKCVEYLRGHIRYAQRTNKALKHTVLWGSGGLGKSTLMKAVANQLGGQFFELTAANLRNLQDVFSAIMDKKCYNCRRLNPYSVNKCLYCNHTFKVYFIPVPKIKEKDILFLEECHRLKPDIEEALYSLMQDGYIIVRFNGLDQAVTFPDFTIAGATTLLGDLNKPFRDRFKLSINLQPYTDSEIEKICKMYCEANDFIISDSALEKISAISNGIPRIAKKYVDDAITRTDGTIDNSSVDEFLELLNISAAGLDLTHRKILNYIHIRGQAGDRAIATSVGIQQTIYLEVYEPVLLHKELIQQGGRGRMLTEKAKDEYFARCTCKHCTKETT